MGSELWSPLPGMSDIAWPEVSLWQKVEDVTRRIMSLYGFREIRTPILERTTVFIRAIGEGTDVVQKEMFTFEDRGGRAVALRPEGTAGVMRALCATGQDLAGSRVYYMGPMFRAERPQAGRRRQFHQIGAESLGPASPHADAECMALMSHLLAACGVDRAKIRIHTRGAMADAPQVREALVSNLRAVAPTLCSDCQRRLELHPLRILDCKQPGCRRVVESLPPLTDWMSAASREYFEATCNLLETLGVPFEIDRHLVRGLDYYEHTIWEAVHPALGAQDAVAGGGRYRIQFGDRTIEGVGFAVGVERLLLAMQGESVSADERGGAPKVWLVAVGPDALRANLVVVQRWRQAGVPCGMDVTGRSVKGQMRLADRSGARWVLVRGEEELQAGTFRCKDMTSGQERTMAVEEIERKLLSFGTLE